MMDLSHIKKFIWVSFAVCALGVQAKDDPRLESRRSKGMMPKSRNISSAKKEGFSADKLPALGSGKYKTSLGGSNPDIANVELQSCRRATGKFEFSWDKASIKDIVSQISQLTCESFIFGDLTTAKAQMTIMSRSPVTVEGAWDAFLAALESNDLALAEIRRDPKSSGYNPQRPLFYKIIRRNESARSSIPVYSNPKQMPRNDGMVTYLHEIGSASKDNLRNLVKQMVSKIGEVEQSGDYLIITDSASNIQRILQILGKVDVPGARERIRVIDVLYKDAGDVAQKVNEIFDSKNKNTRGSALRPPPGRPNDYGDDEDFSLNKIVVFGSKLFLVASDKAFERIKHVVAMMDVPGSSDGGQVHIYKVRYGDVEKIASTLSNLTQAPKSRGYIPPRPSGGGYEGGTVAELFDGDVKVTSDANSRSLVIVGSTGAYKAIRKIVEELDQPRVQVYVEAVIMDIGITDQDKFGINVFGALPLPFGNNSFGLISNPAGQDLATKALQGFAQNTAVGMATGLSSFLNFLGVAGPSIELANGLKVPSFGAVLEALQANSNVDVLSTPSIMMQDNEKAEIAVGQRYPVSKGLSSYGLGTGNQGLGIPLQNISYEDIKLKFNVTPHVNEDDKIRLEIEQDVSELGQDVVFAGNQTNPVIRTKTAKTVVVAADQQTVVLGGLMSNTTKDTVQKIPILGDIPLFGNLFKRTVKEMEKRNLLLVLTPYIIRTDQDYVRIYERKIKEREDFSKMYFGDKYKKYDPYVDYNKKIGPLGQLIRKVDREMQKIENGGPGLPGEMVVQARAEAEPEEFTEEFETPETREPDNKQPTPPKLPLPVAELPPEPPVFSTPIEVPPMEPNLDFPPVPLTPEPVLPPIREEELKSTEPALVVPPATQALSQENLEENPEILSGQGVENVSR